MSPLLCWMALRNLLTEVKKLAKYISNIVSGWSEEKKSMKLIHLELEHTSLEYIFSMAKFKYMYTILFHL